MLLEYFFEFDSLKTKAISIIFKVLLFPSHRKEIRGRGNEERSQKNRKQEEEKRREGARERARRRDREGVKLWGSTVAPDVIWRPVIFHLSQG